MAACDTKMLPNLFFCVSISRATYLRKNAYNHGYRMLKILFIERKGSVKKLRLSEYLFSKELEFALLPVAIIPPEGATRGLNLLGVYGIHPCNLISSTEMARREFDGREADGKTRRLERYFLEKIALELAKNYASEIITKPD